MSKVLIVMGSDSDFPVLEPCFSHLKQFGLAFEAVVCSAHRTPENAAKLAREARENGFSVIIAAAGLAAHLPGVIAAFTTLPVIGIPVAGGPLNGQDALHAIVQMPAGIPVATVAIDGAENAALLAISILSLSDDSLAAALAAARQKAAAAVLEKNKAVEVKFNG